MCVCVCVATGRGSGGVGIVMEKRWTRDIKTAISSPELTFVVVPTLIRLTFYSDSYPVSVPPSCYHSGT